ncbi:hypothetical protein [Halanaerobacter jeridensis]|uniref:Uncharacterized protein n=1 Tax=Halanaerobacter jeridensis TaxID=706427 RepID=A0A938XVA3_9FIRM|nr:hypothetical protein [Halanaerobacter jeridensis]MBM7558175.1 hypothetical protein [Halanaerobacter jeridensis]
MNNKSDFEKYKEEYRDINNNLVIPSYRKFCKELDLPFHFWNELSKEDFDPRISLEESPLHKEAMEIFNIIKPEVVLFKDKIIKYQFTSWDGQFRYNSWSVSQYLEKTSDELFYLKKLEESLEKDLEKNDSQVDMLIFIISLLLFVLNISIFYRFINFEWLVTIAVFISVITYHFIKSQINIDININSDIPERIIDDDRLDDIKNRIMNLRKKINKISDKNKKSENKDIDSENLYNESDDIEDIIYIVRKELYKLAKEK